MKQLGQAWTSRILVAAALAVGGAAAYGQQAADPYTGVSQPPPDDTIVASPDAQPPAPPAPPAAKPSPARPMMVSASASSAPASAPISAPAAATSPKPWNPDDDI